jgi:hypothetical protein
MALAAPLFVPTVIGDGATQTAYSTANPFPVAVMAPGAASSAQVQVVASSGNKAATSGTAAIAASATKTSYITGFDITGTGATATSIIAVTVSDGTWTQSYELVVTAGVTGLAFGVPVISVNYPTPLAGSAINTAITVTLPSLGAGSTNACVNARGFQA